MYGCAGRVSTAADSAISASRPPYITAIFVAIFAVSAAALAASVLVITDDAFRDQIVQFAGTDLAGLQVGMTLHPAIGNLFQLFVFEMFRDAVERARQPFGVSRRQHRRLAFGALAEMAGGQGGLLRTQLS